MSLNGLTDLGAVWSWTQADLGIYYIVKQCQSSQDMAYIKALAELKKHISSVHCLMCASLSISFVKKCTLDKK